MMSECEQNTGVNLRKHKDDGLNNNPSCIYSTPDSNFKAKKQHFEDSYERSEV